MDNLLKKEGRCIFFLIFLILVSIFTTFIVSADDVTTEVNVSNAAPILLENIPNQTWPENKTNLNAFDLDDYFIDPNAGTINYTHSNLTNITIVIGSENTVSFYPDDGFIGTRNVTFFASDGQFSTPSNQVYLNVGTDNEPPQWVSSSRTGGSTIYQNDYINFSAIWTDNVELRSYIFSIKQGNSWENYTETNFSGKQNTSTYRLKISASSGTEVYWKFYAFDTSGNINHSPVRSFNISSLPTYPPPSEEVTGDGEGLLREAYRAIRGVTRKSENFTVSLDSFKISLKQGKTTTTYLKITNIGNQNLSFEIYLKGLEDFAVISDNSFYLDPGASKDIIIDYNIPKDSEIGEYNGIIVINSTETRKVPVVLIINPFELVFDIGVNISEEYKIIKPGNPIKANITISNVKDIEKTNANLYIAIKDFWGNIYDSSEQKLEFTSSLSLQKELQIPETANEGDYLYYARISNNESMAIGAESFQVGVRAIFLSFLKSSFLFLLILFLCIILAIFMVRLKRKKEREKLLRLYLMVNEMKKLIKDNKLDEALNVYIRIKTMYGEKVPEEVKKDKQKLKKEIKKLSRRLKKQKIPKQKDGDGQKKNKKDKDKKENKEESDKTDSEEDKNSESEKKQPKEEAKEEEDSKEKNKEQKTDKDKGDEEGKSEKKPDKGEKSKDREQQGQDKDKN